MRILINMENAILGDITAMLCLKKEMKGGLNKNKMETKSRYEVVADLEEKKRDLIVARESLGDKLKQMERDLRDQEREVSDQKEEIEHFKGKMEKDKVTYNELIKSVDESLKRFAELGKK